MQKRINIMLIILALILLMTGCKQQEEERIKSIEEEMQTVLETSEALANRVEVLEENNQVLLDLVDEQVTILSEPLDKNYFILPIYHTDIQTYDERVQYYAMIPKHWSMEKKVQVLADKLSRYSFSGASIELLKIEALDDGKRVAVINLMDSENRESSTLKKTWATNYLQGSAGSSVTTEKLTKTFLQREFEGEWIDGVKFLYNDNETNTFEHVGKFFGEIHYRD